MQGIVQQDFHIKSLSLLLLADLTTDESAAAQSPHNCPLPIPVKKLSSIVFNDIRIAGTLLSDATQLETVSSIPQPACTLQTILK